MTRTLDPKELAEMREIIFEEINFARGHNDDLHPKPPDDLFRYDDVSAYVAEAQELLDTIKHVGGDAAEMQYVLVLGASTSLIELLEWLRDTGGVE